MARPTLLIPPPTAMPCCSLQLENTAMFSDAGGQIQRPAEAKHFFLRKAVVQLRASQKYWKCCDSSPCFEHKGCAVTLPSAGDQLRKQIFSLSTAELSICIVPLCQRLLVICNLLSLRLIQKQSGPQRVVKHGCKVLIQHHFPDLIICLFHSCPEGQ